MPGHGLFENGVNRKLIRFIKIELIEYEIEHDQRAQKAESNV